MIRTSLEGQTVGKYRVLEPLGRGGMARVYRAYHPQLDRYVAIKVLRWDLVDDEGFLARFRREAQAVAGLRHPNVVQVHDFDVLDEVSYMVMELLEGDTLKARLNDYRVRDETMPVGEMVRILLDVLDGLAYAHSEGMVHRDVKPANILLTRRGQAVITDFGIAQIVGASHHTAAGALMGTLNYIAPEQGLEGQSDVRSDIYSLGIVFYEMLTQRTPFDADTPLAVLMKHLNDPLPLPRQVNPEVPEPLERVVLKALAKDPEDRYQSAAEMAGALRESAGRAGIELPARISLPMTFTTAEAPSESVAVFSGTARHRIEDVGFAAAETDPTLGERLKVKRISLFPRLRAARGAPTAPRPSRRAPEGLWKAVWGALGLLALVNLALLWVANFSGQWELFEVGWPVELFLVAAGLFVVMAVTSTIWLLIPAGIMLGNGALFAYSSLTGNWRHWVFLWAFELAVIVGSVLFTVRVARREDMARRLSRVLGGLLGFLALVWGIIVAFMAMALAVVGPG